MRKLLLLRHGEVEANPEHRFVGSQEVALSLRGREQYRRLGAWLAAQRHDVMPSAIFCSDLSRSLEGATALASCLAAHGHCVPVHADAGFREISLGAWEGCTKAQVEARYPGSLQARGRDFASFVPEGGESFGMVQRRALAALARARSLYPQGLLVLVGHAALNRTILAHYLALPLSSVMKIPQPYACATFLKDL